jgi:hypothetical protein
VPFELVRPFGDGHARMCEESRGAHTRSPANAEDVLGEPCGAHWPRAPPVILGGHLEDLGPEPLGDLGPRLSLPAPMLLPQTDGEERQIHFELEARGQPSAALSPREWGELLSIFNTLAAVITQTEVAVSNLGSITIDEWRAQERRVRQLYELNIDGALPVAANWVVTVQQAWPRLGELHAQCRRIWHERFAARAAAPPLPRVEITSEPAAPLAPARSEFNPLRT